MRACLGGAKQACVELAEQGLEPLDSTVKASTAGGERTRLSAAFTAAANGYKLPIFAIIPRQTPVPQLDGIHNMVFKYRTKATFDESVILEYFLLMN